MESESQQCLAWPVSRGHMDWPSTYFAAAMRLSHWQPRVFLQPGICARDISYRATWTSRRKGLINPLWRASCTYELRILRRSSHRNKLSAPQKSGYEDSSIIRRIPMREEPLASWFPAYCDLDRTATVGSMSDMIAKNHFILPPLWKVCRW